MQQIIRHGLSLTDRRSDFLAVHLHKRPERYYSVALVTISVLLHGDLGRCDLLHAREPHLPP